MDQQSDDMSNDTNERQKFIQSALSEIRGKIERDLELCEKVAELMIKMPDDTIGKVVISQGQMMLYGLSRDQALAVIKSLGGRWNKQVNPTYSDRIDYLTEINGVPIEIYGTDPPSSCRIELVTEEIPAHTVTRRQLVCK